MSASRSLVLFVALACGGTELHEQPEARVAAPSVTERTPIEASTETESPPVEASADPTLPVVRLPLDEERAIDDVAARAIARRDVPGAVVLVGRRDGVVFRRAYGLRQVEPHAAPMTEDTLFDLASLTKPFTALVALRLADRGSLALDAPVEHALPELAGSGITTRDLLTHRAGLRAVNALGDYEGTREERLARTLRGARERPRGGTPRYGDLHFIALGALLERTSGLRLDASMRRELFEPLDLKATFTPLRGAPGEPTVSRFPRIAPTERAPRRALPNEPPPIIHGDANDPRAWRLDGIAGHAGLFATADDLARLAEALLADADGAHRILSPTAHAAMRRCEDGRALGWDCSDLRREGFSPDAFGHGGYTGTWLWIDPTHDLYVVVLTNRVHPDGGGRVGDLRSAVSRVVLAARDRIEPPRDAIVLGVDRVRAELEGGSRAPFALRDRRVALLTHDAGRARDGLRTSELFWRAHLERRLTLARLFAPEHGLASDAEGTVASGTFRGIPVTSLFGRERRPSAESLADVDVIVVDVQDVGARFFTYASTVHEVLRAAAEHDVDVMILDRPNPLGATSGGPLLDLRYRSFVNHHPLPLRHGLTIGALARKLVEDDALDVSLHVVELMDTPRDLTRWDETGLRWTPPSPNLPTWQTAWLYLGVALVEGTNVSVGRGTDTPFAHVGAPFVDSDALLEALGPIEGLAVTTTSFTPEARPYRGERCRGLAFAITDPERFDPLALGAALVRALAQVHPNEWDRARLPRMIGDDATLEAWLRP